MVCEWLIIFFLDFFVYCNCSQMSVSLFEHIMPGADPGFVMGGTPTWYGKPIHNFDKYAENCMKN